MKGIDIEALKALRAKATSGEWVELPVTRAVHSDIHATSENRTVAMWVEPADAAFITAIVNAWPRMVEEMEQLQIVALAASYYRAVCVGRFPGTRELNTGVQLDAQLDVLIKTFGPRE